MYSSLPEDTYHVTSRLAAPLRGVLRTTNSLLGAAALALISSAVYMNTVYHRTGLLPPSPEPAPSPGAAIWTMTQPWSPAAHAHRHLLSPLAGGGEPWFIYAVFGVGVYTLGVAVAGASGSKPENRRRLFTHIVLLAGLVVAQAAALLLLFAAPTARHRLPGGYPLKLSLISGAHACIFDSRSFKLS